MINLVQTKAVRTNKTTKMYTIQKLLLLIKIKHKVLFNKISFPKTSLDQTDKVSLLSREHLQFQRQDKTWFPDSK